ncbi:hypothetical protein H311_02237 [Anncaliia algerae PRA109]|nr:hypothetical protein H311_02237 [Anncaliia algerae PRA109]
MLIPLKKDKTNIFSSCGGKWVRLKKINIKYEVNKSYIINIVGYSYSDLINLLMYLQILFLLIKYYLPLINSCKYLSAKYMLVKCICLNLLLIEFKKLQYY